MTDKTKKTKERLADVLKMAIKGEIDGFKFYNLLAKKASNDEARRRLETLRDDEIRHKEVLYELYEQIFETRPDNLPEKGINALAAIFSRGQIDPRKSEMDCINLAIESELAATKFYQTTRNEFDEPQVHALFDQLADEEHSHYELLQAEKEAMGGNYHWFSLDGGAHQEH